MPADESLPSWFVRQGQVVRGPYSSARIRRELNDGELRPADLVSVDGRQWQVLSAVPEVLPPQFRGREIADDTPERDRLGALDRARAIRSAFVLSALLALATAATLWLGRDRELPADARCDSPPAPEVAWRNCRLDGLQAAGADLRRLSGLNLSLRAADLERSLLSGADLRYADLAGARLGYAELAGADLLGATLRGADLTYADLSRTNLSHSDLRDARLGGTVLTGARLSGALWIDGRRCAAPSLGRCE